jgi:hypothetical protein
LAKGDSMSAMKNTLLFLATLFVCFVLFVVQPCLAQVNPINAFVGTNATPIAGIMLPVGTTFSNLPNGMTIAIFTNVPSGGSGDGTLYTGWTNSVNGGGQAAFNFGQFGANEFDIGSEGFYFIMSGSYLLFGSHGAGLDGLIAPAFWIGDTDDGDYAVSSNDVVAMLSGIGAGTNGLAQLTDLDSTNNAIRSGALSVTNGLLSSSSTNPLLAQASVPAITNSFLTDSSTNPLLAQASVPSITNNFLTASSTNPLLAQASVPAITNGFLTGVSTNPLLSQASVPSITNLLLSIAAGDATFLPIAGTNGFAKGSITNGLATSSITNGLLTVTGGNILTQGLATVIFADGLTNGFLLASAASLSNAIAVSVDAGQQPIANLTQVGIGNTNLHANTGLTIDSSSLASAFYFHEGGISSALNGTFQGQATFGGDIFFSIDGGSGVIDMEWGPEFWGIGQVGGGAPLAMKIIEDNTGRIIFHGAYDNDDTSSTHLLQDAGSVASSISAAVSNSVLIVSNGLASITIGGTNIFYAPGITQTGTTDGSGDFVAYYPVTNAVISWAITMPTNHATASLVSVATNAATFNLATNGVALTSTSYKTGTVFY